jgi:hypothetical protein
LLLSRGGDRVKNERLIFDLNRTLRADMDSENYKSVMETCERALDLLFKYAIAAIEALQKEAEREKEKDKIR